MAAPSLAHKIKGAWDIDFADLQDMRLIGGGNFGQVHRGTYHGTEVAVKKLLDVEDEFMHKYIEREMAILR